MPDNLKVTGLLCHCGSNICCEMVEKEAPGSGDQVFGEGGTRTYHIPEFYCSSCGAMYYCRVIKINMDWNAARSRDDELLPYEPRLTYDQLLASFHEKPTPP